MFVHARQSLQDLVQHVSHFGFGQELLAVLCELVDVLIQELKHEEQLVVLCTYTHTRGNSRRRQMTAEPTAVRHSRSYTFARPRVVAVGSLRSLGSLSLLHSLCVVRGCGAPRMTSLSLTMFGWLSTRSDATSRSLMHSSHEWYFFFIFLMATTSPLLLMPAHHSEDSGDQGPTSDSGHE